MEIADIEGEDYNLEDILPQDLKEYFKSKLKHLIKQPPRIILSKLYYDNEWHGAVLKAAKIYITRKINEERIN